MGKSYINYHCHSHYSNIILADSADTEMGYINRIKELGHEAYVSTEHGGSANWVSKYLLCKKNGIKFIFGAEAYVEYEGKAYHMIMLAKNDMGKTQINRMLYDASVENFKNKRARLTLDIIKRYEHKDVVVTNACIGGLFKEESGMLIDSIRGIFGSNLWIEVAPHKSERQISLNKKARAYAKEHGLIMVSANDSHYANEVKSEMRADLLEAKRINYGDDDSEDDFYMDYPSYEILVGRYREQGMWSESEIENIISNTNLIMEFEDIDLGEGGDFKVPTLYPNLTRRERCEKLLSIINEKWHDYKHTVSFDMYETYKEEISRELREVFACKMEDYFLTAKGIVDRALLKGGVLTKSSRGSSSSFFINMLLGFTTIDRIKSKVPILMERFMTADRILEAKGSPDIDFNIADKAPFVEAQQELLGIGHSFPMIAYGLLKPKSAFKMMCKAKGDIPVDLQNLMSEAIDKYEKDLKHADDEDKEDILLEDYMENDELYDLYKKGEDYFGIVSDCKVHPCGYVIANTNLIDIFGVVVSPKGDICLNLEGKYADELGYLKLDWLTVSVVDLTDKVYKEIGIPQPTAPELYELVEGDDGTWEIYENGFVQCVNQVEKSKTRDKCMRYSPRSVEDLCAFIASIRPGFMSYYKRFESREDFRFGVEGLDNLLRGKFLDGSWCLYQEQVMKVLKWIGFDSKDTYSTLKGIGKKKLEVIMKVEEKFANEGVAKLIEEGATKDLAEKAVHDLWEVIRASANYSFNSSHSYSMAHDSLWIAYAKAHYPLQTYKTCIEFHSQRKEKDKVAKLKKEAEHFGIKLQPMKFGQDNRGVTYSAEKREIYQNLMSVKNINGTVAEIVYALRDQKCDWFDFMLMLKSNGLDVSQIEALIKIGYFSEFGHAKKLLWLVENFKTYTAPSKDAILKLYGKISSLVDMTEDEFVMQIMSMADKVTAKQFRFEDELKLIRYIYDIVEIEEVSNLEQLYWEVEYLGSPDMEIHESVIVGKVERLSYNQKFKRTSMLISDLSSGLETWVSQSIALPVQEKNIVYLSGIKETVAKNGKVYKSCSNTLCLDVLFKKPKKEGKK